MSDLDFLTVTTNSEGKVINCFVGKTYKEMEWFIEIQAKQAIDRRLIPDRMIACYGVQPITEFRIEPHEIIEGMRAEHLVKETLKKNDVSALLLEFVSLRDTVFCLDRGIPVIPDDYSIEKVHKSEDYQNAMESFKWNNPDLKSVDPHGYQLTVSNNDVFLYGNDKEGSISLKHYLQWLSERFFNKQIANTDLKIYDLPSLPEEYKQSFRYFDGNVAELRESKDKDSIIHDLQKQGRLMRGYDLSPTGENFWKFVNNDTGEGLHLSQQNYDIYCTMNIMDKGFLRGMKIPMTNHPGGPYSYSHEESFKDIKKMSTAPMNKSSRMGLIQSSMELAGKIMDEQYSDIRKPVKKENRIETQTNAKKRITLKP